ncbi:hypothetical protein [Motiliproteus sediminis]|uniref:hypothetical protein n=1 Tax=Motiliproteus sediminis TaxID=1468178 RepID=UPI001AEFF5AC|nr:hypothetical protein [Motiliproteus sediminis]
MHNFKMIHLGRVDQTLLQDLAQIDRQLNSQDSEHALDATQPVGIEGFYDQLQLVQGARRVDVELAGIQGYLATLASERRQLVGPVRLSWLAPGASERRRVADDDRVLYCLMLQGQRGMIAEIGDERIQMRPGELWQITQGDMLKMVNDSQESCVMLSVELSVGLGLPQYQGKVQRGAASWFPHALAG